MNKTPYDPLEMSYVHEPKQQTSIIHLNKSPLNSTDKLGILILLSLYFIQGIPLGVFDSSIPFLLLDKGAEFKALGLLTFFSYPFALKILFAPFEDAHFIASFGKRKSYIIPCQYILSLMFFIAGFYIEDLINNKEILTITAIGFFMVFLASLQDIAVDGWQLTLLQESHLIWGSVAQSIGQMMGNIVGSSVFIQLNSVKFCNNFLYSEPRETPILQIRTFFFIISALIFTITVIVHVFKSEKNPEMNENLTVWQVVKSLKGFFQNKNLKFLIFHLLFWRIGFSIVLNTFNVNLIKKGFSKETLMNILTALIPLSFFISFIAGKCNGKGSEMKIYLRLYLLKLIDNVFLYLLVTYYSESDLYLVLFTIGNAFSIVIQTGMFVIYGGFANRISDADMGGTYLTFLNSIHNLGGMWTGSLAYYLVAMFDYSTLVLVSWCIAIGYFCVFHKEIERIGRIPKKEWSLKSQ